MADEPEDGCRATTPPGDNLLCDFVRDYAASFRALAEAGGRRTAIDDHLGLVLVDNASATVFLNPVVLLRPLAAHDTDTFAQRVSAFYDDQPGGEIGVWSLWPTPDLRSSGFLLAGHPPLMLRPPGGTAPPLPRGLRIEQVTDDASGFAYETALVDGMPVPDLQPLEPPGFFSGPVLDAPYWQHFVGSVDGVPVACASASAGDNVVRVDNVATLAAHRGRGYGAALTWAATLARPELPATLLASEAGRPVYERMGYRTLLRATFWLRPRA